MKKLFYPFFPSILILFFSASVDLRASDFVIPLEVPEYRILYDYLERCEFKKDSLRFYDRVTPLESNGLFDSHFCFGANEPNHNQVKPYLMLSEDYSSRKYSSASAYESVRAGFFGSPARNFYFYTGFILDEKLAKNASYNGKKWRGLAGEVETAYLMYQKSGIRIIAGRYGSSWGPSRQSLILSETARPMDAIQFRGKWGRLLYSYQFAKLNRIMPDIERYFSGHRLDIAISRNLFIGFFETIIYGGAGRSAELGYLNPLMFYHSFQLNQNDDDNTFLGLDFALYLNGRHKLYGQLLVDDFQIDKKTLADNEPNEIGFQIGAYSIDLFNFFDIRAEYIKITNRTYNQLLKQNRYDNRGELIGHKLGPDSDRLSLSFSKWFENDKRGSLDFAYQRKGEGTYLDEWTEPWLDVIDYSEPFPTGIVEKTFSASLNITGYIGSHLYIDGQTGIDIIDNLDNIEDNNITIPYFSVKISFLLSTNLNISQR